MEEAARVMGGMATAVERRVEATDAGRKEGAATAVARVARAVARAAAEAARAAVAAVVAVARAASLQATALR